MVVVPEHPEPELWGRPELPQEPPVAVFQPRIKPQSPTSMTAALELLLERILEQKVDPTIPRQ